MAAPKRKFFFVILLLWSWAVLLVSRFLEFPPDAAPQAPPDYTLIEPGLYLGGRVAAPPPDARAVLCLSKLKDPYQLAIHEWRPIVDGTPAPSLEWLRQTVDFIDAQRRQGNTLFIHCDLGVSRGPMVTAAYLMWRDHISRNAALARLRTLRPQVHPNPSFMALLDDWQRSLTP